MKHQVPDDEKLAGQKMHYSKSNEHAGVHPDFFFQALIFVNFTYNFVKKNIFVKKFFLFL